MKKKEEEVKLVDYCRFAGGFGLNASLLVVDIEPSLPI